MAEADNEIGRLNVRIPQAKLEWLREELDSFTSDTGRVQFLIQYYYDDQTANGDGTCDDTLQ